jgi:hypothetical protein
MQVPSPPHREALLTPNHNIFDRLSEEVAYARAVGIFSLVRVVLE